MQRPAKNYATLSHCSGNRGDSASSQPTTGSFFFWLCSFSS
ncbi:hypothetical protein CSHISOI_09327 [Colletotrichum shisoi]|uniref:Uncharacterized protein n=1 Tax=Colletotrichum shisoi TaxID=2078593 RepID=A0A5Q4BH24_9PEZI|nr:hypothetical protein CSHISOI_09327 [Colletotrichum shisoi]